MEGMLPDILATFIAAGLLLVQQRKDREAAERERQLASHVGCSPPEQTPLGGLSFPRF